MPTPVTVLYFAAIRDAVGIAEESLALPDAVRQVADLPAFFARVRPALEGKLGSVRFAVNETFATPDTGLRPGDVIAVIPPVSGG